jgi:hypothetical protein
MKKKKIEKLFYKSLDGAVSPEENELLQQELKSSEELRKTSRQINEIRQLVSSSAETSFKPFFEERLLTKLNSPSAIEGYFNNWANSLAVSFRQVALAAIIILAVLVSFNLNAGNKYSIENLLGISHTNIESAFDPVNNLLGSLK